MIKNIENFLNNESTINVIVIVVVLVILVLSLLQAICDNSTEREKELYGCYYTGCLYLGTDINPYQVSKKRFRNAYLVISQE